MAFIFLKSLYFPTLKKKLRLQVVQASLNPHVTEADFELLILLPLRPSLFVLLCCCCFILFYVSHAGPQTY